MLRLIFKRTQSGAHLSYFRVDGTSTWSDTHDFFARHDLVHAAVESMFGFREAFFGLIESGRTIQSFEEKQSGSHKHAVLPEEAYVAEVIVGHLDNLRHSSTQDPYPLEAEIRRSLSESNLSVPGNLAEKLEASTAEMNRLHALWSDLEVGQILELTFPLPMQAL